MAANFEAHLKKVTEKFKSQGLTKEDLKEMSISLCASYKETQDPKYLNKLFDILCPYIFFLYTSSPNQTFYGFHPEEHMLEIMEVIRATAQNYDPQFKVPVLLYFRQKLRSKFCHLFKKEIRNNYNVTKVTDFLKDPDSLKQKPAVQYIPHDLILEYIDCEIGEEDLREEDAIL